LIAVVILIAVFAVSAGIVGVFMLSNPSDDEAPAMLASVAFDNTTAGDHRLVLLHEGGDKLEKGAFQVYVDGEERTADLRDENGSAEWTVWENGQALTLDMDNDPEPDGVLITSEGIGGGGAGWVLHLAGEGSIVTVVPTTTMAPGVLAASFTASPTSGPAPLRVAFTDISSGRPDSWSWDFGDNTTSGAQNPTHTFAAPGIYQVRLTARNAINTDTATRTITVVGPPTANFSASTASGIIPLTVQFTDRSTGAPAAWLWEFGDGTNSTGQNPSHTYTTAGTHNVTLNVSNAAGTDTASVTVRASACGGDGLVGTYYPTIDFTGTPVKRSDQRIWFADANGYNWYHYDSDEWNWPSNTLGKTEQFSVIYEGHLIVPADDTYTFYLTSDDGSRLWIDAIGGSDTPIIDNWGIHVPLERTSSIHLSVGSHPIKLKMYENEGAAVFHLEWSSPAFARAPVDAFCHDPVPVSADFTATQRSGTAPLQVQFTDTSAGEPTAWLWDFGDGTASNEQNPTHTYTDTGTYTISLTASNTLGSDRETKTGYIVITAPSTGHDVVLNTANGKSGDLLEGGYLEFRVTGPYSYVEIKSSRYNLAVGDTVRLEIGKKGNGHIDIIGPMISQFDYDDITLNINGEQKENGNIKEVYISSHDTLASTLTLHVPSKNKWTEFRVDGERLIYGSDNQEITLSNLMPGADGVLNLDNPSESIWFTGSVTDYTLSG
jgi:PKD repeat protein/FlaG/FlaF family flagellin (archaellin)